MARNDGKYISQKPFEEITKESIRNLSHTREEIANIQVARQKFDDYKKGIQRISKYSKGGHGRKRKTKRLAILRDREKNIIKKLNEKIGKELIELCIRQQIGTIHLENLTGLTSKQNDRFFKSFAYYQLQNIIINKAKENSINVIHIRPKDTSITCFKCGNKDKEQRNFGDKKIFKCLNFACENFDKEVDADYNAAQNISKGTKDVYKEQKKQRQKLAIQKKYSAEVVAKRTAKAKATKINKKVLV